MADYPDWPTTVETLCYSCGVTPLDLTDPSPDRLITKAEECKQVDPQAYSKTLGTLFGKPTPLTRTAYNLLMKLPFKAYVTTNFDPLLSIHGGLNQIEVFRYPDLPPHRLGEGSSYIYYIHGLADEEPVTNLVLARSDFEEAYEGAVGIFLGALLPYFHILFLGCSLREPAMLETFMRIRKVQERIFARPGAGQPKRFALLPIQTTRLERDGGTEERDFEKENSEERRFTAMDIVVRRYEPKDGSHLEIEQFLEHLCELTDLHVKPKIGFGYPAEEPAI